MKRADINGLAWGGTLVPLALALLAVGVPFLLTHGFLFIGLVLQRGFRLVCHQQPERSISLFGGHVAVCARCLGIYLGATLGAAAGMLFAQVSPNEARKLQQLSGQDLRTSPRMAFWFVLLAASLNLADILSEMTSLYGNSMGLRFALGALLGFAAAAFVRESAPSSALQPSPGSMAGSSGVAANDVRRGSDG
jgi:hypothetical protein